VLPIGPIEKSVLHGLIKHANYTTGADSYPGVETLAWYSGVTGRAVQIALKKLIAGEWIELQAPGGRYQPATYRVRLDVIRSAAARIESGRRKAKRLAKGIAFPREVPKHQP
jgi:hypothetical protein